jgi:hypothetical protein
MAGTVVIALFVMATSLFLVRDPGDQPGVTMQAATAESSQGRTTSNRFVPSLEQTPNLRASASGTRLSASGRLAAEAEKSRNLREFVNQARLRVEEGGMAYAHAALAYCSAWLGLSKERDKLEVEISQSNEPTVQDRYDRLAFALDRCSAFLADELSTDALVALYVNETSKDPVIEARRNLQQIGWRNADERASAIRKILLLKDPQLLAGGAGLALQATATPEGWAAYVDGKEFGGTTREAYVAAWALVPCAFGAACDRNEPEVAMMCVVKGECYESKRDLIAARFGADSNQFAEVLRLSSRLIEIVRQADAQALMPPGGSAGSSTR